MYEISELANVVPLASELEQESLIDNIAVHGQTVEAVLWRGKIVDGRCRQIACIAVGKELKVRSLDPELSEEEVRVIVKSLNTRRNLTMTQKIVTAYREFLGGVDTLDNLAKAWAVSKRSLSNCSYIGKYRPALIEPLFNGNSVEVLDVVKGKKIVTNRINTIARLIKEQEDGRVVVVTPGRLAEREYAVDGQLQYEEHKRYFYEQVNRFGMPGADKEYMYQMALKELLKVKQELEDLKAIGNGKNV